MILLANVRGFSNSEKYIFVYICIYLFIFDLMTSTPLKPEFEVDPVLLWPALPGRGSRGDVCGEHSGLVPGVPGLKQFKHNEHALLIVPENTGIIVSFVFHFVDCDHFYLSWNLITLGLISWTTERTKTYYSTVFWTPLYHFILLLLLLNPDLVFIAYLNPSIQCISEPLQS